MTKVKALTRKHNINSPFFLILKTFNLFLSTATKISFNLVESIFWESPIHHQVKKNFAISQVLI